VLSQNPHAAFGGGRAKRVVTSGLDPQSGFKGSAKSITFCRLKSAKKYGQSPILFCKERRRGTLDAGVPLAEP
jgi:hypothetical protein